MEKRICCSLDLRIFKMSLTLFSKVCVFVKQQIMCCKFVFQILYSKDFIESLLTKMLLLIISRCLSRANITALIPNEVPSRLYFKQRKSKIVIRKNNST